MFQHPAWVIANLLFWIALHPLLRVFVYPQWELKPFIHGMELLSAVLILLQGLSLLSLYPWRAIRVKGQQPWRGLALLPVIWLLNSLVLWVLQEFHLVQDPVLEPLYDSQLFIRRYPASWTALSFLLSGVFEEIFFRAWLPDFLQKYGRRSFAILGSALLFAVAHWSQHTNAQALIAYLLFAVSLSYVRSMHGLGAAIVVHFFNNVLAFFSQVFALNLFTEISKQPGLQVLVLLILVMGFLLIGRDLLRVVDKGA